MVKHTPTIRRNCLSVFDHFVILALKGLILSNTNHGLFKVAVILRLASLIIRIIVSLLILSLAIPHPRISESCIKIKSKLNFYFHTCLWCLKRFSEGL